MELEGMAKRANQWVRRVDILVAAFMAALPALQAEQYDPRQQDLIDAAQRGDVAAVQVLLHDGVSVNARDDHLSAFEYALGYGRSGVVAAFLSHGANANARGPSGSTPLEIAIPSGNAQVVHLLLTHGADPNTPDPILLSTPLMAECSQMEPHVEIVRDLIAHGAHVNAKNRFGNTDLMIAAGGHKPAVVQLLLTHGAQVNTRNRERQSAVTIAQEGMASAKRKGWSDYASSDAAILRLLKQAGAKQ